ncbi:UDP-4-amino-4,6-dideoxy-N-acetyl-beta-L-altrosamine transaminase [Halochromatium salexigens]|uniref:UDP-4-amino-4, 6-dideoxy-N-acetyl-beta-L-altrosamine transaminase n=1 Tax=Halochromatium salexigens TaxID=49447 RepID=A0AAJ0UIR8_HALSE|nr:UDP-4-amino-4,6-dideoxy-N-acetyl-beta-L-altrosamine transaminase [Halochromatium salexigens]MBK5931282.1 UDP-4-amino-4,6-dideoxy-N-acetyl-beta-L-altrosamine transaminase [Halochromatium salexigens]
MIPYGRQDITEADIAAVEAVLRSDFLTQGPAVPRFEQAVAAKVGAANGVAVNSATSALHLACRALDLGPGDWLWTSPNTFVASANCARYCGARVDFVDIDLRTYNLSAEALSTKLEQADKTGTLPKIVIPVHFAGQPCDMPAIAALAERYGFKIIEDASHAIGARCDGEPVGNGRHSSITVFSFHPVKLITTGEGGLATTNDPELAERMTRLRSHGITRDPARMQTDPDSPALSPPAEPWYYQQIELGYNYRMTDIQAALGLSQLQRLDDYIARRHALAERYDRLLVDLPVRLPYRDPRHRSALHLYPIQVADHTTRAKTFQALRDADIGVNVHYIPVHTQPDFQRLGFKAGDCPVSEVYYERTISLPLYPAMTEAQQDGIVAALQRIID